MNITDTAAVLAKCAAFDQRTVADEDVAAWHEVIGHLDLGSCLAAVTAHYREHTHRAMPAEVRKLATDLRARNHAARERARQQLKAARRQPDRTGAAMCRFVLDRLRTAGQDPAEGRFLGRRTASDLAERAAAEWLALTSDLP